MSPRVAVGTDGTMAVSWTYQDPVNDSVNYPNPVQKIQVAVLPAGGTAWSTTTLDQGPIGGVAITQFVPVAVDAQGNITAAWSMWNGTKHVVQTATKPKNGAWSAPVSVSSGQDGIFPVLSVNATATQASCSLSVLIPPRQAVATHHSPHCRVLARSMLSVTARAAPGHAVEYFRNDVVKRRIHIGPASRAGCQWPGYRHLYGLWP